MIRWRIGGCETITSASSPSLEARAVGAGSTMHRCAAPLRDRAGRRGGRRQLLQGRGQRQRIAGELRPAGVGQVLALPAHRHREDPGDDRRDDQGQQPEHQDHERRADSRPCCSPLRHPLRCRRRIAPRPQHPSHPVGHQRDRAHHPGQQRHQPDVQVPHVGHLVGHDRPAARRGTAVRAAPRSPRCWRLRRRARWRRRWDRRSGTIQIFGRGRPEAIAISSTTFTSCFCSGVAGSIISRAPVDQSTRCGAVAPGVPADPGGDKGGEDADEGNDVVVGAGRRRRR